jgi:AAA15 family ATPase/GTPase
MIIDFRFENFRSFRDKQSFSMRANSSRLKEQNTFTTVCGEEEELRLLKSVAVYGANAAGKSNFIRALAALRWFVTTRNISAGQPIPCYEPYDLGDDFDEQPAVFELLFVKDQVKYKYYVNYTRYEILLERLEFYPLNKKAVLFERESSHGEFDEVVLGSKLRNKRIGKTTFKNQLYLSRFGSIEPHEHLTEIWRYFYELEVTMGVDRSNILTLSSRIAGELERPDNERLRFLLNWLLFKADDHIKKISVNQAPEEDLELPDQLSEEIKQSYIERYGKKAVTTHQYWLKGKVTGQREFDMLDRESTGTNIVFALGGLIMLTLERGGVLLADEFNSGLHPYISRFLVGLFHNRKTNPHNAQIIFNTHEISLLDKDNFRSDQIWFVQKNEQGDSELYSAQDFDGVREEIPFEKWYMAGKFEALPTVVPNDYSGLHEKE